MGITTNLIYPITQVLSRLFDNQYPSNANIREDTCFLSPVTWGTSIYLGRIKTFYKTITRSGNQGQACLFAIC